MQLDKTKRGRLGRVLKGRVPAGIAYGYKAVEGADGDGRGARTKDPEEASLVRHIFKEFAGGKSPEAVARNLNREGIAGRATARGRTPRSAVKSAEGPGS